MSTTLISAQANGTSSAAELGVWDDQEVHRALQVEGTFNGATVTLELSVDGTNFAAKDKAGVALLSCTEAAYTTVNTVGKAWCRIVVAGGGGSESIDLLSN